MAYIAPNTTVRLLRDVILSPNYVNTIYFQTSTAQSTYFTSKKKYEYTAQYYQRHSKNSIKLAQCADDLFDCNYMMFQNTSFGSKWFYAFVTNVEYISNNVCEVFYEIDIMQTWFFDCILKPCMIDRNHVLVSEDGIGANITTEPIQMMEYTYSRPSNTGLDTICSPHNLYVALQIVDVDYDNLGEIYEGVYSGAKIWVHKCNDDTDLNAIKAKMDEYLNRPDAIIGMYTIPYEGIPESKRDGGYLDYKESGNRWQVSGSPLLGNETFGGYTPKNKKLYTYPYNFYKVIDSHGNEMSLRYEYSSLSTSGNPYIEFDLNCNITTPIQIVIRPNGYKGIRAGEPGLSSIIPNCTQSLTISDFPLCSWSRDYYSTWMSQNSVPMLASAGLTLGGLALGAMPSYSYQLNDAGIKKQASLKRTTLDPTMQKHQKYFDEIDTNENTALSLGMQALPNAVNALSNIYSASIHADIMRGNPSNGNVDIASNIVGAYGWRCHIPAEQARMVDDYFDKFGYAIGETKAIISTVGNTTIDRRNLRPQWTYIKTSGCTIEGRAPASDIAMIESIYDRGITFWTTGDNVGRYDLTNR